MDRAQRLYLWLSGLVFAQAGYIEEGEASYYAASFEGLRTASGERYSRSAFTAAHRTLPFGTRVKVTHLRTGKTTIVYVNDRGPHRQGRIIDLS
jgi:rare lipoprotein A